MDERASQSIESLKSLRAVRQFRPDRVPDEVVHDILEVARWSGSASNRQAAEIVVVHSPEMLKRLAALHGYIGHLAGAALGMILVMPGEWPEGDAFDEGRLAERIMLAAAAHGVGSSIGWFVQSGRDDAKRILGVPANKLVRTAISLGYPAGPARRGARKPLSQVVHEEKY